MSDLDTKIKDLFTEVFGEFGWKEIPHYKLGEKMVEKEIVEVKEDQEIVVPEATTLNTNIFGTTNPADFVKKSQEYAKALVEVVESQKLFADIQGKKYVTFEGWQYLGSMLPTAITPQTQWVNEVKDESTGEILGYKARVIAKDVNGAERGAAESVCMFDERNWKGKDANHLMSMAQTRASSKALRMALSAIVKLAGFEPTPKEEMDGINAQNSFKNTQDSGPKVVGMATDKQLDLIKAKVNQNKNHPIVNDKDLLVSIARGEINKDKADKIIKWLNGEIDSI